MGEIAELLDEVSLPEGHELYLKRRPPRRIDITGQTFGFLTAIRIDHISPRGGAYWLFRCKCGNTKVLRAAHVKNGATQSCGCIGFGRGSRAPDQTLKQKVYRNRARWRRSFDKVISRASPEDMPWATDRLNALVPQQ